MTRILVYTRTFYPVMGGLERNSLTLAGMLAKWGYDVRLLTETLEKDDRSFTFKVVRTRSRWRIAREVMAADLVLMNGGLSVKVCAPALLSGRKYVPIYQSSDLFLRENDGGPGAWARRFFASLAALHVTVSHFAKARLHQLLPEKVCLALPNPIDAELMALAQTSVQEPKEYDLLFAGRLIDGKGIFHLLQALDILRDKLPLKVAFAGEGEHHERLVKAAQDFGLSIQLLGRLDRESLIAAYRKARALVVPSSTHTEGNPLVIAEALSFNLPVIASDQGAMVEAVGDAGCCFKRGNTEDLAHKIEWLFTGAHLEEATRRSAGRRQEFSLEEYGHRLRQVLAEAGIRG